MTRLLIMLCMMLSCTTVVQAAEGHIHAVIVSGGMNRLMNHERYWNDCAFLYRTLRQDYHMAKEDIIVLMSDGGDPANDQMTANNNGLASSNPDLDGDGIDTWRTEHPLTFSLPLGVRITF